MDKETLDNLNISQNNFDFNLTFFLGKYDFFFTLESTKAKPLAVKHDLSNVKSMLTQNAHASCQM